MLITLMLQIIFLPTVQSQNSARMKEVYQKMAVVKGYGILFCVVDSIAVTAMTTDFSGPQFFEVLAQRTALRDLHTSPIHLPL